MTYTVPSDSVGRARDPPRAAPGIADPTHKKPPTRADPVEGRRGLGSPDLVRVERPSDRGDVREQSPHHKAENDVRDRAHDLPLTRSISTLPVSRASTHRVASSFASAPIGRTISAARTACRVRRFGSSAVIRVRPRRNNTRSVVLYLSIVPMFSLSFASWSGSSPTRMIPQERGSCQPHRLGSLSRVVFLSDRLSLSALSRVVSPLLSRRAESWPGRVKAGTPRRFARIPGSGRPRRSRRGYLLNMTSIFGGHVLTILIRL